ncbi:hypothetical protein [Bradyrhizobium japonicum]|uniref:hypothetical protein n=1 Tax=Bradyrhizobium japonicum TaxID=375 RepID=UPI00200BCBE6|nr:hypothetical protein [Bradyrhizobium japonicum]UQE03628.1 hypothetical protein JEY30_47740 [Bradyrhizobium japonicum]
MMRSGGPTVVRVSADADTAGLIIAAIERAGNDGASPTWGVPLQLTTRSPHEAQSSDPGASVDLDLLLDGAESAPMFHSAWTLDRVRVARQWRIGSPAAIGILEVLAAFPEADRISAVVIQPASRGSNSLHGPIDSLRFDQLSDCSAPAWLEFPNWRVCSLVAPHTRCWTVSLAIDLRDPISSETAVSQLLETGRVVFAPEAFGFGDTALLAEFFRDLSRPLGAFAEIVVLPRQLELAGSRLHLWLAMDEASQVAQALDCVAAHVAEPEVLGTVRGNTERALGLLRGFSPPPGRRQ